MNRVHAFLAKQLSRKSNPLIGEDRLDYRGEAYQVVFDTQTDQKDLEPGFYSHSGARLELLVPATEFETKPVFTLKSTVCFRGRDWKVDEIRQGDAATHLALVDPKAREA